MWNLKQVDAPAEYDKENLPELSAAEMRAIVSKTLKITSKYKNCKTR